LKDIPERTWEKSSKSNRSRRLPARSLATGDKIRSK